MAPQDLPACREEANPPAGTRGSLNYALRWGNARAMARKASLASASPMLIRAPSAANGRTAMPSASQAAANSAGEQGSTHQTKLASVGGMVQPSATKASRTLV